NSKASWYSRFFLSGNDDRKYRCTFVFISSNSSSDKSSAHAVLKLLNVHLSRSNGGGVFSRTARVISAGFSNSSAFISGVILRQNARMSGVLAYCSSDIYQPCFAALIYKTT